MKKNESEALRAFNVTKLALKLSEPASPEPDPPDGTNMKVEGEAGSCRWQFNCIDSEIIPRLPDNAKRQLLTVADDHMFLFLETWPPLGIRCFVRQIETNPRLGRWLLIEASADPGEIKFSPEGPAACAFHRIFAVIAAHASHLDTKAWNRFVLQHFTPQ